MIRRSIGLLTLTLAAALTALPLWAHEGMHEQIASLTRRIANDPKNGTLYLQRGELYRLHTEYKLARADYDKAAKLDSSLPIEFARGRMYVEAKQPATAKKHLDRFIAQNPNHSEAFLMRGRALVALGRAADAVADYDAAIEHESQPTPDMYHERAKVIASTGKTDDALRGLDAGIARLGPIVSLQRQAIELEVAAGHYDRALARLETIADQSPRKEYYLADRGEILEKAGRTAEAQAAYRDALERIATLPGPRQNSKMTRDLTERLQAALKRATK
ncbi:MAG TPA: tetratricopeptide repeat protein [Thermoanaerobaculia bacterium]